MKLCVIPARGGSKRIPRKNIKEFCGKPMIGYSIEAALQSNCFDQVVVSTDDKKIAEMAKSFGASVPFMRPDELANDYAGTIPVIKHAIEWFEEQGETPSVVCCLYATAPFVQAGVIQRAYEQLQETQAEYCFTVTSFAFPIQRAIKLTEERRVEMFYPEHFSTRSQDLEEAYHDAGQFYWGKAMAFKQQKPLFSGDASPYILPRHLVQDIDTVEDWKRAELMYQVLKQNGDIA
ncbi:pseudaminic acid cytidylyltransferase [Thiomicrorhabdus immobilis]|uniref:Pseudaminic acid cytidylyltransferase n=1 Tax=Thiomicrorhabdus immobilis TaxID=2791037 RepID=A0ABN6CUP4_9GAMM|nr:pseudaminic acid cytidylyltransferase [Thiomicrorhabdus immobilis]BCN92693.1 pseudaminic acid cytidylyltransferase [Thiomicrorhabdus immobilis]